MSHSPLSLLSLLSVSCGGPSTDAGRYAAVATMAPMHTERAFALCGEIREESSRGDCAFIAATRGATEDGLPLESYCERVPQGVWRSECYFQASEKHQAEGDVRRAAALCLQTGPFADDCAQHLWQDEVRGLIFHKGPLGFAEQLPRAETTWRRWRAMLGEETDLTDRFWRRYYQNGFEAWPLLDLSECQRVEGLGRTVDDHVERCRHAGAHLLLRRVRRVVVVDAIRPKFCAAERPSCEAVADVPQLSCVDDPLLSAVLAEQLDWVCVQGRTEPAPDSGLLKYIKREPGLVEGPQGRPQ